MALFLFARAIIKNGHHTRDFTYVEDIVGGIMRVTDRVPGPDPAWEGANPDPASSSAPNRLCSIGSNRRIELLRYIEVLKDCLGRKAEQIMKPLQIGDMPDTIADVDELNADVGYQAGYDHRGWSTKFCWLVQELLRSWLISANIANSEARCWAIW